MITEMLNPAGKLVQPGCAALSQWAASLPPGRTTLSACTRARGLHWTSLKLILQVTKVFKHVGIDDTAWLNVGPWHY